MAALQQTRNATRNIMTLLLRTRSNYLALFCFRIASSGRGNGFLAAAILWQASLLRSARRGKRPEQPVKGEGGHLNHNGLLTALAPNAALPILQCHERDHRKNIEFSRPFRGP